MIVLDEVSAPVDCEELVEALSFLQAWQGRGDELPPRVRAELKALSALPPAELCPVELVRGEIVVALQPRVRALLGTLRAHGAP